MLQFHQTEPLPCEYIHGEKSRYFVLSTEVFTPTLLDRALEFGFRRYGSIYARQDCESCNKCKDLSLDLQNYSFSRSLRRVRKINEDLRVQIEPIFCDERILELYNAWQKNRNEERNWNLHLYDTADYLDSFEGLPELTQQLTVRDGNDRIIAISMIDIGNKALNAHYTFYDIEEKDRSLGTFCVTEILFYGQFLGKERVYLGPINEACPSLKYKKRYHPGEEYNIHQHTRREVVHALQEVRAPSEVENFHPTKWVVTGSGPMAQKMIETLEQISLCSVVGVVSRGNAQKKEFFQKRPEIQIFSHLEEAIENTSPDAAYIATPHSAHFKEARTALERRVATLVEKPAVLKTPQWRDLVLLSEQNRTLLMEGLWTRFFPFWNLFHSIPQHIDTGPLEKVEASFQINVPFDPNHRLYDPTKGGGALWDLGIYPLVFFDIIFHRRMPKDIEFLEKEFKNKVDTHLKIQMLYDCPVTLSCSLDRSAPQTAILTFEKGSIIIPDFYHPDCFSWKTSSGEYWISLKKTPYPYTYEILQFLNSLKNQRIQNSFCTHRDTERILSLLGTLEKRLGEPH